jgi:hypothetical protein
MSRWHPPELVRYYKSPQWKERKSRYYQTHPRRCLACGKYATKKVLIYLHHTEYPPYWDGSELDEDLWPLCLRDHRNVHEAHQSGRFKDLQAATTYIVERGKRRQRTRRVIQGHWQRLCLRLSSRNRRPG